MMRNLMFTTIALMVAAAPAQSQTLSCSINGNSCNASQSFTLVTIPELTLLSSTASSFSLFGASGIPIADFAAGFSNSPNALGLSVRTNVTATRYVKMWAGASNLGANCPGVSLSNITWGATAATRTTAIPSAPASAVQVASVTQSEASKGVSIYFRVALAWSTSKPSTSCDLPLQFTLSSTP